MNNKKEDFLGFNDGVQNRFDKRMLKQEKALEKLLIHMDVDLKKRLILNLDKSMRKTKAFLKFVRGWWILKLQNKGPFDFGSDFKVGESQSVSTMVKKFGDELFIKTHGGVLSHRHVFWV